MTYQFRNKAGNAWYETDDCEEANRLEQRGYIRVKQENATVKAAETALNIVRDITAEKKTTTNAPKKKTQSGTKKGAKKK